MRTLSIIVLSLLLLVAGCVKSLEKGDFKYTVIGPYDTKLDSLDVTETTTTTSRPDGSVVTQHSITAKANGYGSTVDAKALETVDKALDKVPTPP